MTLAKRSSCLTPSMHSHIRDVVDYGYKQGRPWAEWSPRRKQSLEFGAPSSRWCLGSRLGHLFPGPALAPGTRNSQCLDGSYLEGSQAQLNVEPGCHSGVLGQEGKHSVVHPKQRDEEQSGFSQPPATKTHFALSLRSETQTSEDISVSSSL